MNISLLHKRACEASSTNRQEINKVSKPTNSDTLEITLNYIHVLFSDILNPKRCLTGLNFENAENVSLSKQALNHLLFKSAELYHLLICSKDRPDIQWVFRNTVAQEVARRVSSSHLVNSEQTEWLVDENARQEIIVASLAARQSAEHYRSLHGLGRHGLFGTLPVIAGKLSDLLAYDTPCLPAQIVNNQAHQNIIRILDNPNIGM